MVNTEIRFHRSWFFICALVVWTLAEGIFPYYYKQLSTLTYWWMGLTATAGFFFSLLIHEFSHVLISASVVSPIRIIRMYVFGGVFESEKQEISPWQEIVVAVAGPVSNLILFFIFQIILTIGKNRVLPLEIWGIFNFFSIANFLLALFNFLPAYPLDGGRIIRAILVKISSNAEWSTRICAKIGSAFGLLVVTGGITLIIRGFLIGGIWWFITGLFLQGATRISYQKYQIRKALEGVKVSSLMTPNLVVVPGGISIRNFVEKYAYKYHHKLFPVVNKNKLVSCVLTRNAISVPLEEWEIRTVGEIASAVSTENTVRGDVDAVDVFSVMNRTGHSRLLVLDSQNRLKGIVVLKDFLKFFSYKLEFSK